jgi:hypothetical protein
MFPLHLKNKTDPSFQNTVNSSYPPSRFAIFRYNDSKILVLEIRYPAQIPAIANPHPEKINSYFSAPPDWASVVTDRFSKSI